MEIILEWFIPSDIFKRISDILKKVASILVIVGMLAILESFLITIIIEIIALLIFIESYFMHVDYEYELYNGNITIINIYNASIRRVAQIINLNDVKTV